MATEHSACLVDTITYPNGTKAIHSYNGRNWLTSISNQKSDNTIIAQFDYTYDTTYWGKNGTRTGVTENILKPDGSRIQSTVDYAYDDLYRLTSEVRTGNLAYSKSYIYDAAGNRTRMVADGVQTDYTYDAANKMLTAGASSFTYDDKGNTLTETNGSTVTAYTWDFLNRMTQWAKTGQATETYLYNAGGMRVRKTPAGATQTDFFLDMNEVAEETTGTNDTSYVGPGLTEKVAGTDRTIYHADGIGSTRAMSDSNQAITQAEIYDAYGNRLTTSAPISVFGFVGWYRYYADDTGLDYLKARYYEPSAGRFTSRDPIGYAGGLGLYAYVGDSPVNAVDPSGLYGGSNATIGPVPWTPPVTIGPVPWTPPVTIGPYQPDIRPAPWIPNVFNPHVQCLRRSGESIDCCINRCNEDQAPPQWHRPVSGGSLLLGLWNPIFGIPGAATGGWDLGKWEYCRFLRLCSRN